MPEEGEGIVEHLTKKYGAAATQRFNDPNSSLMQMGRAVDIHFNNDRKMVNTRRAHALVEHVKDHKSNEEANLLMQDLYESYFVQAKNINDESLLINMVSKFGVTEEEARNAMTKVKEVETKDRNVKRQYGVTGVPFFMIHPKQGGRPLTFSGAYPVDVIAEQLQDAAGKE